jgi:hypothetical protein
MSDFDIADLGDFSENNDDLNISDNDDFNYIDDNISNHSSNANIIDMDEPISDDNNANYSSKVLGKLVTKKSISTLSTQTVKPIEKKLFTIVKKTISPKATATNKTVTKNTLTKDEEIKTIKKISKFDKKDNKGGKDGDTDKETKEDKANDCFEFNEETIEFYTRDSNINLKDICVKKSHYKNDTVLLCLLFKANVFTEYRCNMKKCKTGKTWLGKPIQLLINRKNSKMEDLTTSNLELICPNCFIIQYGLDLFQKTINQTIYKCKICNFPLNKFSNFKKKEGYCMACENKIINASYYSKQNEYINELKETIDNTSALKKDDFTHSNYFNEVSQYKTFKDGNGNGKGKGKSDNKSNKVNKQPIIQLNMNIPDLSALINEDILDET